MSDIAGSRSGAYRTLPDVWRITVNEAMSERDLVEAVRDYLATWQPGELSELPEDCRPGRITSGEDVSDLAFKLSQAHLDFAGNAERRAALERMIGFFVHASTRFAQLARRDPFPQQDG